MFIVLQASQNTLSTPLVTLTNDRFLFVVLFDTDARRYSIVEAINGRAVEPYV